MDNNQTLPITQKSQLERLVERMHREHTESLRDLHDEIRRLQELCAGSENMC
jgi:hypothetical protein